MKYRQFGNTGMEVSELGFGGIPILRLTEEEAIRILRHAYDRGITFYDTANAYGDSEAKIGAAFAGMRDKVVIATKTMKRDAAGVMQHLETSLKALKSDYIDLFQLHQVAREKEWATISGPGGALEALQQAKQEGKIRHIGITSHNLEMAVKLVKTGLFASVQFPFNLIENDPVKELHPQARSLNLGILGMKPFGGGAIDSAKIAFKFLRQYPDVLVIPGYDSVAGLDEIVEIYEKPNVVTDEDLAAMDKYRQELGRSFCRRCEYCQPCPNGVFITVSMGYAQAAHRMSPKAAANWLGKAMESTKKCIDCGVCITKCPYELPIPEILRKNYDLYEAHRAELSTGN